MSKNGTIFKIQASPRMEIFWQDKMRENFPSHFHEHYVIGCMLRGERIYKCGEQAGKLRAHEIMFINPGQMHECRASGKAPSTWLALHFPIATIFALGSRIDLQGHAPFFPSLTISDNSILEKLLALACKPSEEKALELLRHILPGPGAGSPGAASSASRASLLVPATAFQGKASSASLPAFFHLLKDRQSHSACADLGKCRTEKKKNALYSVISSICSSFLDEPDQDLSLDKMAQKAKMGKFVFLRKFKNLLGISPCRFLDLLRLNLARDSLYEGGSLSQCAQSFGYYDQSHLTRHFTANFGFSPACFQKACSSLAKKEKNSK